MLDEQHVAESILEVFLLLLPHIYYPVYILYHTYIFYTDNIQIYIFVNIKHSNNV